MTAVQVSEDVHLKIQKKKIEILEKYGRKFDIKDIADAAIIAGFGRTEEMLGLVKPKEVRQTITDDE